MMRNKNKNVRWLRLGLALIFFLAISVGLGYLLRTLLINYHIPLDIPIWLAFLVIFGILLIINLSVLPLPFGVSIMLVAAAHWNPVLVALAGSLGASIGESSGYLFGYLGKRVAVSDDIVGYKTVQTWVRRYGMWAIAFLSFQPVIPFEIGGFVAGVARMSIPTFLLAIWMGKFPKYLLLIYVLGDTMNRFFPHIRF